MNAVAPTFRQIKAQVKSLREKAPNDRVFGIHTLGRWTGQREYREGDDVFVIDHCDSPLALRVALREATPENATRVLLTSLDDRDISEDIRIRLARRRLFHVDSWQVLQTLFQAHAIDPRLSRQPWMAEQILELASKTDCPAAPGGIVDLETAWAFLLVHGLGFGFARPDLPSILKWSLEEENVQRFRGLSEEFRSECTKWLSAAIGPAVRLVLRSVACSSRPDALPIGLAAQVLFHPRVSGKLDKAVVRLEERFLGGESAEPENCQRWGAAAREVLRLQIMEPKRREALLKRADAILKELEADAFAYLSDVSLLGFDQRLEEFGRTLKHIVEGDASLSLDSSYRSVREHDQAKRELRRIECVEMATRLTRWLKECKASPIPQAASFAASVQEYLEIGSFVDLARLTLRNGDAVGLLSDAYLALFNKCQSMQEIAAERFATLLQDWTAAGSNGSTPIPVEEVLSRVVAPLAEKKSVLLIVMDGMSVPVFNRLIEGITQRDWSPIAVADDDRPMVGLATIPSVTEFSRTSLLCGKLISGNSSTEQIGFAQHAGLAAACRTGIPPKLFHKTDLHGVGEGGLLPEIRTAISSKDQIVVGVVINAIDDHLLKGDQLDIRWSRDEIRALPALLHEAKLANRIVVMVSDHGHVLEFSTSFATAEGGDRWCHDRSAPTKGELKIAGSRVLNDSHELIAPWSENVRYGMKKNGYHGGLNPQEMVVPIAVLVSSEELPAGWIEKPFLPPRWWSDEALTTDTEGEKSKIAPKPKQKVPESLLDWREDEKPQPTHEVATPSWIAELTSSPVYVEQKKLAGRSFPKSEDVFVRLLDALAANGGKMTTIALARSIGYPPLRLGGMLAISQRVLNLDGYEVLGRDEDSDTISLNMDLLRKQFELS